MAMGFGCGPVHRLSGLFRLYAWAWEEFVYMGFPCISSSAVSGGFSNTLRKTIAAFLHLPSSSAEVVL